MQVVRNTTPGSSPQVAVAQILGPCSAALLDALADEWEVGQWALEPAPMIEIMASQAATQLPRQKADLCDPLTLVGHFCLLVAIDLVVLCLQDPTGEVMFRFFS